MYCSEPWPVLGMEISQWEIEATCTESIHFSVEEKPRARFLCCSQSGKGNKIPAEARLGRGDPRVWSIRTADWRKTGDVVVCSLWMLGSESIMQASIAELALTDVGMHRVTILCYPLVCVHCGPVVDFFITKQTSLHPFDFVRNLFHLLYREHLSNKATLLHNL